MLDPAVWNGDLDDLVGHADQLAADPRLCDRLFATKHEAYVAGRHVEQAPQRSSARAADREG